MSVRTLKPKAEVTVLNGHEISLSHREKVFFPKTGLTKGDVLAYYAGIAERMVPLIKDHPLMLQRFPNGLRGPGFIQQDASDYFPDWIHTASMEKEQGRIDHVLANDAATLVYLANQGVLAFHMWQSRADKPDYPDRMVFDLDPPAEDFSLVAATAQSFRLLLEKLELPAFAMTTGSRGLHVVVPLKRQDPFDEVREFGRELGAFMAAQAPEQLTIEHRIAKRGDRLFLDPLRNTYAHTAVAPYSVRPKEGAPVAAPITWEELKIRGFNARFYNIRTIFDRLEKRGDPWRDMGQQAVSLGAARKRFSKAAGRRGNGL